MIDYLDRASAHELAAQMTRVLRPDGALLGFFASGPVRDTPRYTKYIIVDEVNLQHRWYPASRGRGTSLLNRDIIRMFSALRVSDSFLLQNNLREILFRKPVARSLPPVASGFSRTVRCAAIWRAPADTESAVGPLTAGPASVLLA